MQRYLFILLFFFIIPIANAQNDYWQQKTNYRIQVELIDKEHLLNGYLELSYHNHSPDTLKSIWIHLWPNAFRTDNTAFGDQHLENGNLDFYFSNQEERGYINRLDVQVNQRRAKLKDHPQHIDIAEIMLPNALAPGDSCIITTPFRVRLPKNVSRGGYSNKSYQITQWYPKAAVYDQTGWHPYPYLDQGEFYSNFGNYEVSITIPASYSLFTSGVLVKKENKNTADSTAKKTEVYVQQQVHDFAWFADKQLQVLEDTLQLPSGRIINLTAAFDPKNANGWKNSIAIMKRALLFRSRLLCEYPYSHYTAVETEMGVEGGMEYPCITSISPVNNDTFLEEVLQHEIGHSWFQGMIANDERRFSWLDEGVNTYYDQRYRETRPKTKWNSLTAKFDQVLLLSLFRTRKDQPLATSSELFTPVNYGFVSYQKGAQFMQLIESSIGRTAFDTGMSEYVRRWTFKHPYPNDLKQALEKSSGKKLDSLFELLHKNGPLQTPPKRNLRFGLGYLSNTDKTNAVYLTPLAGYNTYDGLMVGGALSNYNLPPTRFQFLLAPLYGIKSKALNIAGRLAYNLYLPKGSVDRIQFSSSWMNFTNNDFTDTAGVVYRTGFQKLVPSVKLFFKEKNPRSTREHSIQWKLFLINEENLQFKRDTFSNGNAYTKINKRISFRYLNQVKWTIADNRVLYPYRAELQAEQTKDFVRLAFTGNYHFNFNKTKGADVRFFAGKFIYLRTPDLSTRFRNDRYHLHLSGPRGNDDYTYSHYFIGRNEFEGWRSQQMIMRDGGFKVHTDLLANKAGKTDNWLVAMNIVSDIPDQINILNALPFKIPLKTYLDIGTYAEAWSPNAEGSRILYNAGLQLSFLKESIQVYFPLFYSKVYRDYYRSVYTEKRFARSISFVIDLQKLNWKTIDKRIPF